MREIEMNLTTTAAAAATAATGGNKSRRRSYGHLTSKNRVAKKDAFQIFATGVRDHESMESRWGVLEEIKVEYFRGKDFVSVLRNHPEIKDVLQSNKHLEAEDIVNIMLQKEIIVRCDRVSKTVKPGKSKLSACPAHLEISSDQVFSDDDDAFFVWVFVNKRRPLWKRLLNVLLASFVPAICSFRVCPQQVEEAKLDSSGNVLLLLLCLLLMRSLIYGALWIILGKYVWFFPNILDEEVTLRDLFDFCPKKDEENERPKWTARLYYKVLIIRVILLVWHHAPHNIAKAGYQEGALHLHPT